MKKFFERLVNYVTRRVTIYLERPRTQFPHEQVAAGKLVLGENAYLGRGVVIDCTGDVIIGKNTILGSDTTVFTHSHVLYEGFVENVMEENRIRVQPLTIGDNVTIAREVMILGQVESIGDNAIIGARTLLTKNVGPGEIWGGNPGRKIGDRDPARTVPLDSTDADIR